MLSRHKRTSVALDAPMEIEDPASSAENEENNAPMTVESKTAVVSPVADRKVRFSPELLKMYYSRLFPYSFLYDWLSYGGNTTLFSRREFSFTIENQSGDEIYLRYQSFTTQDELSAGIMKRCPTKIDIGAIFEASPKDKHAIQSKKVQPAQRELVFDIDLTDYDEVRNCGCSGAKICSICWGFMKMAIKTMDEGLRKDFGFSKIAWFYSGRRGVHAWVSDESARMLTDEGRSAVARYFELDLGSENNAEVKLSTPLHPMITRTYELLEPMFIEQVLPASGHGLLATISSCEEFLKAIPDAAARVREELHTRWTSARCKTTPKEKWIEFKSHLRSFLDVTGKKGNNKAPKNSSTKDRARLENLPVEYVFRYGYPRLDINVSKMRNHLLKSPFCVHPKTGRVCVPIRPKLVDSFDPFTVPTLDQLMDELDEHHASEQESTGPDWKRTSLKAYFEPFQKEVLEPMIRESRKQGRDEADRKAAVTGDF